MINLRWQWTLPNAVVKHTIAMSSRRFITSTFGSVTELNDAGASIDYNNIKFTDKVKIEVKGGRGGSGCISYETVRPGITVDILQTNDRTNELNSLSFQSRLLTFSGVKRPDGGNGGNGGNVYIAADAELSNLSFQTFHFNAMNGGHGGSKYMTFAINNFSLIQCKLSSLVSRSKPMNCIT